MAARMAIIAMTTNSSMRVKARRSGLWEAYRFIVFGLNGTVPQGSVWRNRICGEAFLFSSDFFRLAAVYLATDVGGVLVRWRCSAFGSLRFHFVPQPDQSCLDTAKFHWICL